MSTIDLRRISSRRPWKFSSSERARSCAMTLGSVRRSLMRHRRPVVIGLQLAVAAASHYAALLLRFPGSIPQDAIAALATLLPILILLRGIALVVFRLHDGLWRYTSVRDLLRIVAAIALSSLAFDQAIR